MLLSYRHAVIIALGIFVAAVSYIFYIQNDLVLLHNTEHENYENILASWMYLSIFITFILTSILLIAFLFLIKIRTQESSSHKELEHLYVENHLYFDNAAVGFLIVDAQRYVMNVNPMFCSIFGYERDEVISKSEEMFHIDNEHFTRWGKEIFAKAQKAELIRIRYPMQKKDGSKIFVEVSGAPFDDKYTLHDGVVWTVTDVSRNIGRENMIDTLNKELENSLIYFRNMLSIAPMPIFVKDENLCYRECNDAFLKLFEKKKSEVIGKTTQELLSNDISSKLDQNDTSIIQNKAWHYTDRFSINNKKYILDIHKSPIIQNEKFLGIVGIAVDVTRREEQQRLLNHRVKEEVHKNIEQEKRHVEARMQDVKFTVIGQLSAGITHEINTPLTFMKGTVEMMAYDLEDIGDGSLKQSLLEDNATIMEGICRLEGIIANMREMSQKSSKEMQEINIYTTLTRALSIVQNRAKHIVKIILQDEYFNADSKDENYSYKVLAEPQRLEQAWIIIINNALDELEHKGNFEENSFEIQCFKEGPNVKILFSDNGGGIDESIIGEIFDPFVSTKEHSGIGIGLNIAQKIIKDHRGSIKAHNNENGAVIEVLLPKKF